MRNFICLAFFLLISSFLVSAQDEGTIVKKERIDRSQGFFFGLGPSFTFGDNIGDYSTGFNVEMGYQKRLNRVFSIGPSLSYLSFKYDPEAADGTTGAFIQYIDDVEDPYYWEGYTIELTGGDLSLISLALNLKINFVPIKDDSKISVYGFAKPFVTFVSRTEVSGNSSYLKTADPDGLTDWEVINDDIPWGAEDYPILASDTEFTGGIFIGPGVEFSPAKKVSVFVQAAFGYTFPITFVSTGSYDETFDSYFNEEFPMTKEGFPSVNLQVGMSFNF